MKTTSIIFSVDKITHQGTHISLRGPSEKRSYLLKVHFGCSTIWNRPFESRLEGVNRRKLNFTNFKHNYKPGLALEIKPSPKERLKTNQPKEYSG
jgi:hypothetical protein